jgi:hypothetical protein
MSLFRNFEKSADFYKPVDSLATKKSSYPATKTFSADMFVIRTTPDTVILMGADIGDFVANIRADQDRVDEIKKGWKVVCESKTYFVKNDPKFINQFNKYKLLLVQD